jgi:hypothetical protein
VSPQEQALLGATIRWLYSGTQKMPVFKVPDAPEADNAKNKFFPPRSKQKWCSEIKKEAFAEAEAPAAAAGWAVAASAASTQETPFDILE